MSTVGKTQLTIIFIVPPDQGDEGDRIFASHAQWMETHHSREGELALIRYNIIKAHELSEPLDFIFI